MASIECSICLDQLKSPVSTPCGHLHCDECLKGYVASTTDACEATCPTCRAPFALVTPDLAFVPEKFHKFMSPSVRKVYLDNAPPQEDLHSKVEDLEKLVSKLKAEKLQLTNERDAAMRAASASAGRERTARMQAQASNGQLLQERRTLEVMRDSMRTQHNPYSVAGPSIGMKRRNVGEHPTWETDTPQALAPLVQPGLSHQWNLAPNMFNHLPHKCHTSIPSSLPTPIEKNAQYCLQWEDVAPMFQSQIDQNWNP